MFQPNFTWFLHKKHEHFRVSSFLLLRTSLRKNYPYSEFCWSAFSRIRTEYGDLQSKSPYLVRMWKNVDQKSSEYGHSLGRTYRKKGLRSLDNLLATTAKWFNYFQNIELALLFFRNIILKDPKSKGKSKIFRTLQPQLRSKK